ncbi:MAG: sigma-70 family RNA polymerase sigma factor [Actinomycetota bacterium]
MATAVTGSGRKRVAALLQTVDELDERQFESVYHHYVEQLCRFAESRGAVDPEGVADLALFDAYRAFGRQPIRDEPAFRQYLYRAVASRVISEHRRARPEVDQLSDHVLVADDPTHDVVIREWLAELVDELPSAQRSVIQDRFYADLTVTEAADRLGRSDGAVHQLQHRAVGRLRRLVLAGVAVVLVAALAAVAVWRASSTGGSQIDTGPIDSPSPTVPPPVVTTGPAPTITETSVATSLVADEAEASSVTVTPPTLATEATADAGAATADPAALSAANTSTPTEAAASEAVLGVAGASKPASTTTTDPAAPATAQSPSGAIGADAVDSGAAVNADHAALAQPATTANTCSYWFVATGSLRIQLFNPGGDPTAAEAYRPPVMVRFVASDGSTKVLDVSTGSIGEQWRATATGWLPAGSLGTPDDDFTGQASLGWTAEFGSYPLDDIVSIQYLQLDQTGQAVWASAPGCQSTSGTS